MVRYYHERCWCSLMWLYFPIPVLPIKSRHQQFLNHNRVQTIILLRCHVSKTLIWVLSSTNWENRRGFPRHIPEFDDFLLKTKTRKYNNGWTNTDALTSQTILHTTWSVMLAVMFSWRQLCHKAGLISTIGVPCAPSVSPSQPLSYCYAQLGHVYFLLITNSALLEQFALFSFRF